MKKYLTLVRVPLLDTVSVGVCERDYMGLDLTSPNPAQKGKRIRGFSLRKSLVIPSIEHFGLSSCSVSLCLLIKDS